MFGARGPDDDPLAEATSPQAVFESKTYVENLRFLVSGIEAERAVQVLVGEAGTGKTTLIRSLLRHFQASSRTAFLFYPKLQCAEFLQYLFCELGLEPSLTDVASARTRLRQFVLGERERGKRVIVAVDEAQAMAVSVLAMLGDIVQRDATPVQFVLSGQPDISEKLGRPQLHDFRQLIGTTSRLGGLATDEIVPYIEHRLRITKDGNLFTPDAVATIAAESGGIPREINNACFTVRMDAVRARPVNAGITHATDAESESKPSSRDLDNALAADGAFTPPPIANMELACESALGWQAASGDAAGTVGPGANFGSTLSAVGTVDQSVALKDAAIQLHVWFTRRGTSWCGTAAELIQGLRESDMSLENVAANADDLCSFVSGNTQLLLSLGIESCVRGGGAQPRLISLRRVDHCQGQEQSTQGPSAPNLLPRGEDELASHGADQEHCFEGDPSSASSQGVGNANAQPRLALSECKVQSDGENTTALRGSTTKTTDPLGWKSAGGFGAPSFGAAKPHPSGASIVLPIAAVIILVTVAGLTFRPDRHRSLAAVQTRVGAVKAAVRSTTDRVINGIMSRVTRLSTQALVPFSEKKNSNSGQSKSSEPTRTAHTSTVELHKSAEAGDPEAQMRLASAYEIGEGVARDPAEAAMWLRRSAQQGNSAAALRLAMKYRNGDGVPQSDAEAANWLQAAAAEGQANAQYELAMAYMGGRGVPRDYVSAYVWLVAAKASGDSRSENQAKLLTAKLSDLDIARIRARLGEMYWRGIGVPSDYVAAYTWLILAEKAGEKGTTTAAKIELASAMTQDQVAEARERASLWLRRHQRCASCPPDVGKRKFTVGTKAGGRRSNLHRRVYPSQRGGVSQ